MSDKFTCDSCGRTFPKQWSDEEAFADMMVRSGYIPESERAIVCDECYEMIAAWEESQNSPPVTPAGVR